MHFYFFRLKLKSLITRYYKACQNHYHWWYIVKWKRCKLSTSKITFAF